MTPELDRTPISKLSVELRKIWLAHPQEIGEHPMSRYFHIDWGCQARLCLPEDFKQAQSGSVCHTSLSQRVVRSHDDVIYIKRAQEVHPLDATVLQSRPFMQQNRLRSICCKHVADHWAMCAVSLMEISSTLLCKLLTLSDSQRADLKLLYSFNVLAARLKVGIAE